jgi:ubiquinol-cytochrome c reductase cytochrome c subunit
VPNRGPSLIGVGEAAVYFQVHTGRMPLARQEAQAPDKPPVFSDEEIDQLMAYVQANGGGPTLPSGDLRDGDLAEGGELFRLNCASCHNFVGEGGALSSGKAAPSLKDATTWRSTRRC